jgi:hypothetical protein
VGRRQRPTLATALCLAAALFSGGMRGWLHLTFLAPPLTSAYYRFSLQTCLWLSFAAGLLVDLLNGDGRLGLPSLIYCLATGCLYRVRSKLSIDKATSIPILSALFGLLMTLFRSALLWRVEAIQNLLSPSYILTDLILMPLADGLYAWLCFVLPLGASSPRLPRPQ